jgi:hypothetical protein
MAKLTARASHWLAAALLVMALPALAAKRPDAEQKKIDYLLEAIRTSSAKFVRNDAEYAGAKAAAHLKQKLFFAGKRVQTAREFIVGVADHSEETKRPYEVKLDDGTKSNLSTWLMEKLVAHEKELGESPK